MAGLASGYKYSKMIPSSSLYSKGFYIHGWTDLTWPYKLEKKTVHFHTLSNSNKYTNGNKTLMSND